MAGRPLVGWFGAPGVDDGKDVLPGDPTADARPGHLGGIDIVVGEEPTHHR
jgi:hypothetical protein